MVLFRILDIDTTPMEMELDDTVGRQQVDIDTELRDILQDFEG